MTQPAGQAPANPTTDPAGQAPTTDPPTPAQPSAPAAPPWERDGQPFDPARAWNLIENLRADLDKARTGQSAAAETDAVERARTEMLQQIGEALGLKQAPDDPAELAQQLASTQEAEASARLELDVWRIAARLGADPERLLDSRRFASEVDALPDDGFDEKLKDLIGQWVERDPGLRAGAATTPAPRQPVEALRPGALPQPPPPSLADQIAAAAKAGDVREAIRLKQLIPREAK